MGFVIDFWHFMWVRKKFWLFPIFIVLAGFGSIIVFGSGSAITPLVYTLF